MEVNFDRIRRWESTVSDEWKDMLRRCGVTEADVLMSLSCDRTLEGAFADTYLLLGSSTLTVAYSDGRPTGKTYRGFVAEKSLRWLNRRKNRKSGEGEAQTTESVSGQERDAKLRLVAKPSEWKIETFDLTAVEALSVVNLVASGLIVIKTAEGERAIAAFTNGHMAKAAKFAAAFAKLRKGEPLTERELEDEGDRTTCPTCGGIYPEKERRVCPRCMKKHAIFARLLSLAGGYKGTIFWIVLFMLLNSATGLAIPYLQGTVLFDQALGGEGAFAGRIGLVVLLMIAFRTLSLVFGVAFGMMIAKLAANVTFDLKSGIFTALQRLSLQFFQRKQTGQLMTRVNNDATELQYFFVDGLPYFIVNAMNIIGITVVLLVLDWKLTLLCFLPMPLVIVLVRKVFPKLWRLSWRRHRRVSAMNSIISDTLRGSRVVKAFGKEQQEINRFQRANVSFADTEQRFGKLGGTVFPLLNLLTQTGGVLIWAFGGWMVLRGEFTFGLILTFVHYMTMLYGPIQFMNNIVNWWSKCMSAAQRIFEIQDAVPDVADKPDAVKLPTLKGEIDVDDIVFGYEPNKSILKNVSLRAEPGQMIGIVGQSGAGKSTLVNLISRLYDVNEGAIRIDGLDVRDIKSDSLRRHIGIVSQDVYVFSGSIAENIAYAKPDCSMEELLLAAKIANAHDFIEKLPDGYDTIVGTGGHNLSGGEKQRLSIARAILHNPQILILDEATASLDTETELQIQEALDSLVRGRTTIAIAHRLSTLRNADRLVVMEQGKVVESGSHDELMALNGVYHRLVRKHDEALKMKEGILA